MIEPVYKSERVTVYHGDCLDIMPHLELVDAIVTDPPYGIASKTKIQKRGTNRLETFDIEWDSAVSFDWISIACHRLKPGASFVSFCDTKRISDLWRAMGSHDINPLRCLFWHKNNPPPQPRKNFQSAVEAAVFGRRSGKVHYWDGGGASPNLFKFPLVMNSERTEHPTQKPTKLMAAIISPLVPLNGVILDPFAGSGTTGYGALLIQRRCILIERERKYIDIIIKRIEVEEAQPRLF